MKNPKAKRRVATADPSPMSPAKVAKNRSYQVMYDYEGGQWFPHADEMIVRHKKSNTFWRAVYRVGEDNSDYELSATWREVIPQIVLVHKYVIK